MLWGLGLVACNCQTSHLNLNFLCHCTSGWYILQCQHRYLCLFWLITYSWYCFVNAKKNLTLTCRRFSTLTLQNCTPKFDSIISLMLFSSYLLNRLAVQIITIFQNQNLGSSSDKILFEITHCLPTTKRGTYWNNSFYLPDPQG